MAAYARPDRMRAGWAYFVSAVSYTTNVLVGTPTFRGSQKAQYVVMRSVTGVEQSIATTGGRTFVIISGTKDPRKK
jgi:hypothetical protein